ncbi:alkaline phosphatase [Parashewanella curva]|uniref:Alkaline phosphatase n=1 Tax=Parashewanella curva TaxID=2338552 RepID=A0A3L8PY58_9GAMM|nr:alkaline phosphatase [Parashewanella curva]RLV60195.1 alkaline phosphatase [Parashewanella curva]
MNAKWVTVPAALAFAASAHAAVLPKHQMENNWYKDGQDQLVKKLNLKTGLKAKNVILFVGDGMGVSTLTAARIFEGQMNDKPGEEGYLSFEKFPYTALVKTYNVDAQTPDSAGTMTAMISGLKTDAGVIGVDEDVVRGQCDTVKGNQVATAVELAEIKGLSTGVISTARITHATPAATYAKSVDRNWEDVSDIKDEMAKDKCEDIASQLVNFEKNLEKRYLGIDVDGIDFVMGGGRRHFLPKDAAANSADARSEVEGDRTDNRNLVTEWQEKYPQGTYVMDQKGFDAIDVAKASKVFGLFNESHMQYEADRKNDKAGEPSLSEMTETAVNFLKKDKDGFLLVVESGRIDHGHHAGNAYNALNDTVEFAKAVQKAVDNTNPEETLILVTADHSHVFTIAGYPKRGNPILGKVVAVGETEPTKAADGKPYTTLGYANGRGFMDLGTETDADAGYGQDIHKDGRVDLSNIDTTTPGFHQEATVPKSSETHAGEDITLHATGPGAQLVQGVVEQSDVYHIINKALGLDK